MQSMAIAILWQMFAIIKVNGTIGFIHIGKTVVEVNKPLSVFIISFYFLN